MEVKVTFEDFDLEAEVEKAMVDEINRLVGTKMRNLAEKNGFNYLAISEMVRNTVQREVNLAMPRVIEKLDAKINKVIDKEIEGLAKAKVAKALKDYHRIAEDIKEKQMKRV